MRAREFINEIKDTTASAKTLPPGHETAIKGYISLPDISMNNSSGSAYTQYRFGLALAGAHSDKNKSYPTPPASAMAGDPMITTYSDHEVGMVKNAADMVGAGRMINVTANKSSEHKQVHTKSPVNNWNPVLPKNTVKKKKK